jgi:hypothetical protein
MLGDIIGAILDAIEDIKTETENRAPLPPLTEANLRMPTQYPFRRVRHLPWPPFVGHRVPLGGD